MQVIRCTTKMLKELGIQKANLTHCEDDGFLGSWFANFLRIDRRKCILFTNSTTLFSFLVPGILKSDLRCFDKLFYDHLIIYLRSEGYHSNLLQYVEDASQAITIAKTNSRVILGSMNDLAFQFVNYIKYAGGFSNCDMIEIHRKVNRTPMSAIGYAYPVDYLEERMNQIPT